jgi:hypothetical protein
MADQLHELDRDARLLPADRVMEREGAAVNVWILSLAPLVVGVQRPGGNLVRYTVAPQADPA